MLLEVCEQVEDDVVHGYGLFVGVEVGLFALWAFDLVLLIQVANRLRADVMTTGKHMRHMAPNVILCLADPAG